MARSFGTAAPSGRAWIGQVSLKSPALPAAKLTVPNTASTFASVSPLVMRVQLEAIALHATWARACVTAVEEIATARTTIAVFMALLRYFVRTQVPSPVKKRIADAWLPRCDGTHKVAGEGRP